MKGKISLKEFERYIKRSIKGRLSFSRALMISFLISGVFYKSLAKDPDYKFIHIWADKHLGNGSNHWENGDNSPTGVNYQGGSTPNETVLLASEHNKAGALINYKNKDFEEGVVIGSRAVIAGKGATSIGYRAIVGKNLKETNTTDSHQGTAVGYRSFAYGTESTALGNDAVAYGESAISIGSDNIGKGSGNNPYADKALSYEIWKLFRENSEKFNYTSEYSAIDSGNKSTGNDEYEKYLKLENKNKTHNLAFGDSSIAIGSRNVAYGHSSLALGTASVAKGNFSTALGTGVLAFGNSAVAVGNEAYVYAGKSVGIGNNVQAIEDGSMVYGLNSYAGGDGSIALGKSALSNVAPSSLFKDTLEQYGEELYEGESTVLSLYKLDAPGTYIPRLKDRTLEQYFTPETELKKGTGEKKAVIEKETTGQMLRKTGGVAIGYYVYARGENTIAIGRQAYAKGDRSIAFGPYAYAKSEKSAALGYGSKALNSESLSLGSLSRAEGKKSIAIGIHSAVKNITSDSNKSGENSIALGNESIADLNNSIAIGYRSKTDYDIKDLEKVYIPKNSFFLPSDAKVGVVSVGSKEKPRRIVNVAAGYKDTDAANISQLRALEDTVIFNKAIDDSITPYFGVEQANNDGEAARISKGIKAEKNYERYIEIAGRYAELLNRKHYGGDNINNKTLEDFKNEVEKLGRESNIKGTATEITRILTELKNLRDGNHKNESTFKSKYEEIQQAVKADNTEIKKRQVSRLTEQEINDSNYKGNLATGKDSIAIGYGSKATHEHGIALGYKAKSEENSAIAIGNEVSANKAKAITIGNNVTVDVDKTIAMGDGITIQNSDSRYASLAIGNKINLNTSGGSIALTAINQRNDEKEGITLTNAGWAVAIGNKVNVANGNDVVALGNNMTVSKNEANGSLNNNNLIILGNNANAKSAKSSILLGFKSKVENVQRAVAIGSADDTRDAEGAKVTVDDGIALGSYSLASTNKDQIGFDTVTNANRTSTNTIPYGAWKSRYGALSIGNVNNTRQITGVAAGTQDTDAVNVAQLKNATLHFISINGGSNSSGNYDNKGATGNYAIALGIGAQATAERAIALGNLAKATGKSSIAIGTRGQSLDTENIEVNGEWNVGIGVKTKISGGNNIVAIGTGITVDKKVGTTTDNVNNSAVAIGSDVTLNDAKEAIGIGKQITIQSEKALALGRNTEIVGNSAESIAVGMADSTGKTTINNAKWSVAIGNKTSVTGGNDIVALGPNIAVTGTNNASVVAIGNGAKASGAKESVVIGKGAESKAVGAVVIGEGAVVEAAAGESIAFGKGSQVTTKSNADANATIQNVKFRFAGGTGSNKTVFSIGKTGTERIIKNVAAGLVSDNSTDAINGSQLYAVADEFSKLAVDVLGAEADTAPDKTGFKKSQFKTLKTTSTTSDTATAKTFKQAISDNIEKINAGFTFSDGNNSGTRQLGETLTIQAGNIESEAYKSDNIKVNYGPEMGTFRIGIKKDPTFEKVTLSKKQEYKKDKSENKVDEKDLITKGYLDGALKDVASSFTVAGDVANSGNETSFKIDDTLNINGDSSNIETKVDKTDKKVIVTLKDSLTDIESISSKNLPGNSNNNVKTEIKFNQPNSGVGNTSLTIISNGAKYAFGPQAFSLSNKPIKGLKGALEGDQNNTKLNHILTNTKENRYNDIRSHAVNVEDLAKVSNAIINKGLSFEGDSGTVTRKLGETLKIVGEKGQADTSTITETASGNITVAAKKSKTNVSEDTLEIGLAKNLKGIASIENTKDKSKIELTDDGIDLTTSTGKTVKVTDNALEGVNKISTGSDTNANSIDLANVNNGTKNVVITSGGKTLTIAKDGEKGISLTGLADRKVSNSDYGTNGSAGRAATEAAVLDLKTKGLTFEANQNNSADPKTLQRALGETLKITGKDGEISNFDTEYSLENVATKIDNTNNAIRIGLLKTPRFDVLELGKDANNKISLTPNASGDTLELKLTGTGANTNVKISGVANGTGENDAINKAQLASVVTTLGGGASIDSTSGTITNPSYTINNSSEINKTHTTVAGALTALDGAITTTKSSISTLGEKSLTISDGVTPANNFVRKNSESKILTIKGGDADTGYKGTNLETKISGNSLLIGFSEDPVFKTLKLKNDGNSSKEAAFTVDNNGNVSLKKGSDGTASKIVVEDNFKALSGGSEISVNGDGKVFGAETTLSLNDNSIAESKLNQALTNKLAKIAVNESNITSNLLRIIANASNIKVNKDAIANLSSNKLTFKDGGTKTFERTNNSDKNVVFEGTGNVNVNLTSDDSKNTGTFTISVNQTDVINPEAGNNKQGNSSAEKHPNKLTTEKAVVGYVKERAFKLAGNDGMAVSSKLDGTINIKGDANTLDQGNVYVSKGTSDNELKIQLGKNLTGIESITKVNGKSKLELKDDSIVLSSVKGKSLTFDKDGKLSGLSDGTIDASSTDAVTGKQLHEVKNQITNTTIKYRANGAGEQTVALTTGLNFVKSEDDNIDVEVAASGVVKHKLANNLKNVVSITGGSDDTAAKIVLSANIKPEDKTSVKTITINDAKLTGIKDGTIGDNSKDAISGKQLKDLAGKLGVDLNSDATTFKDPSFTRVKGDGTTETSNYTTHKDAIEGLIKAVNNGFTVKGNKNNDTGAKIQLGETVEFDGSDITVSTTGKKDSDNAKITLNINKATIIEEGDNKVVTSDLVAKELEKYLTVTGDNVEDKEVFGTNVGLEEIKHDTDGSSQLIQEKALIEYFKGTGKNSVKLSNSSTTKAEGEGSVAIGHNSASKNEGAISIGYNSGALNTGSISIGQDSNVLGLRSIGIGSDNKVAGSFSFVLGEENKVGPDSSQIYVIGSNNNINGRENISFGSRNEVAGSRNILLGSNIVADENINNAVVLGHNSTAVNGAVSVGSYSNKRKIKFVGDPEQDYDAVNKKYIDEELKKKASSFKVSGDAGDTENINGTLNIKGKKDTGNNNYQNIKTSASGSELTIELNSDLKSVNSISNGDVKLEINKNNKNIVFTSGETKETVTLSGSKIKGISEISKEDDKSSLKLEDNSATLSAGKDKGSIKVSNGTDNKIELSPENGTTLKLEKDGDKSTVKATGLSTIGKDNDNALVFNTGNVDNTTANLKVGGKDLTFTKSTDGIKLSGLTAGEISDSSTEAITGKQLNTLAATHLGLTVDTGKTGFVAPDFNQITGANTNKKPTTFKGAIDDLITAVNRGIKFQGNDASDVTVNLNGTLKILGKGAGASNIKVAEDNIKVSKADGDKSDTLEIGLSEDLKGIKTIELKDEKGGNSKTIAVNKKGDLVVREEETDKNGLKKDVENKIITDKNIGDQTITYKANSKNNQTISLTKGLNFVKDDNSNIDVEVEADGKIKHKLASNITDIESISAGKNGDESAAKITLSKSGDKKVEFNKAKITDILDGTIGDSSTDAITGKQLNNLASHLGISASGTTFTAPSFTAINSGTGSTSNGTALNTHKAAIDALITAVNKGYKYSADENDEANTNKDHYLGSTILFNRLADSAGTSGTSTQIDIKDYKGDNLITRYNYNSGNAKIEIGFKDAPTFSNITLTGTQAYDGSRGNDVITKSYLEQALDQFKINVKVGENKQKIGRGDILELAKGDNIDITLKPEAKTPELGQPATPSPTPAAPTVAPVANTTSSSTPTTVTIATTKELKGLTSVQIEDTDKVKSKLDKDGLKVGTFKKDNNVDDSDKVNAVYGKDGITLNDKEGKSAITIKSETPSIEFGKDSNDKGTGTISGLKAGSIEKNSTEAINGAQLVQATGAKMIEDSASKTKKMVFSDGRDGLTGEETDSMASKGLTSKDGLNGKNANDKANALRNGEAGTVVYTDKEGNRLVKAKDGKYYKADEILNTDGTLKDTANLTPVEKPTLSLVNTDGETNKEIQLSNVASGLEIGENAKETQDKITEAKKKVDELQADNSKEKELKEAKENLAKLEKQLEEQEKGLDKVKALVADGKEGLSNVATVRDLKAIGQAGINVVGNDGKVHNVKISDTLYIKGEGTTDSSFTSAANNIRVDNTKEGMTIRLSAKLDNMKSITFKDNDGVIRGLKAPTDDFDATNKAYVDSKFGETKQLANEALGGVAGAIAMANLVQANSFSDYRHQLSAAFGTYSGKQAIAVGYSGITDSGRLVYKLSGSVDSGGKLGIGAGIGIMLGEKREQTANNYPQKLVKELESIKKENESIKKENTAIKNKFETIQKENSDIKNKFENMQKENAEIKKMLQKLLKGKK